MSLNIKDLPEGEAVFVKKPNDHRSVAEGEGFYVGFVNHRDNPWQGTSLAGDVAGVGETALKGAEGYLILNGDHRDGYAPLIPQGYQACKDYYLINISQRSSWSEDHL